MVLMNLSAGQQRRHRHKYRRVVMGAGEGEGGMMNGESSMDTYTPPYEKQVASGDLPHGS